MRRWLPSVLLLCGCAAAQPVPQALAAPAQEPAEERSGARAAASSRRCHWPLWEAYRAHFISPDGRVIDRTDGGKSTSEGQAYGLFFALVAGDRQGFDRLLRWTEANLARGDLAAHLPAWKWGRAEDGNWTVLDPNAASDADLWLAYVLHEAGRLWSEPRYRELGAALLQRIEREEVAELPGLGKMLLPAPFGFEVEKEKAWRLNPSYLPPQLLRRFADRGPWGEVQRNTLRMLREVAPLGLVADWVLYQAGSGFADDPVKGAVGSYDAIRVYLWAGFLDPDDPLRQSWGGAVDGLWRAWREHGHVPEAVDVREPGAARAGPPGFTAALLPEALARRDVEGARALERALSRSWTGSLYGDPPTYYDQNLILFSRGFVEGRFAFGRDGALQPGWQDGGCGR